MKVLTKEVIETVDLNKKFKQMEESFKTINVGDVVAFKTPKGMTHYLLVEHKNETHLLNLDNHRVNRGVVGTDTYFKSAFENRIMDGNITEMKIYRNGKFSLVLNN